MAQCHPSTAAKLPSLVYSNIPLKLPSGVYWTARSWTNLKQAISPSWFYIYVQKAKFRSIDLKFPPNALVSHKGAFWLPNFFHSAYKLMIHTHTENQGGLCIWMSFWRLWKNYILFFHYFCKKIAKSTLNFIFRRKNMTFCSLLYCHHQYFGYPTFFAIFNPCGNFFKVNQPSECPESMCVM